MGLRLEMVRKLWNNLPKNRVTFDFETRSTVNLKKSGAFKYSLDPSTQPTCLAARADNQTFFLTMEEVNRPWADIPQNFRFEWRMQLKKKSVFIAHNAFFERCIYNNILVKRYEWPEIPWEFWRCTAAKAAACALPRSLEKAGEALKLRTQKDRRGYAAMMATCKPTRQWVAWKKRKDRGFQDPEPPLFLEPHTAPEVFRTLYQYCKIDVLSEEELDQSLPDLSSQELEIWQLNQLLNWRGLRIDIPTVRKIVLMMDEESKKKLKELDSLTMGLVTKPGARNSILEFLSIEGIELPNLQAKTVDASLEGFTLSPDMHRLLQIRKALTMTSTKKYYSFLERANDDDRVRDILMYHGASTGRDTGTGIQPHNFPRGVIRIDKKRPYAAVDNVTACEPETLRLLYGDSLAMLFSSILRNMMIPTDGWELFVADFSKIEVAMLWWLADNEPGLKVLRAGLDPYIYQAAANVNKPYQAFNDESPERQLGKAQVLGCGFGMGWEKFKLTAMNPPYFLELTDTQAQAAVQSYRTVNAAVPALWKTYENCAVAATESPGIIVKGGKCRFQVHNGFLWVKLPSGRKLAYADPRIAWRETDYGSRKTLEFWGVNPKTKKWAIERTWGGVLTENIVQASARDLMMPAMVRLEKAGYQALLMVHDEGICERKKGDGSLEEFVKILCEVPRWAVGCPIEAKGWSGLRYRK